MKTNPLNRGYCAIGLDRPKYEGNVGGAFRAAACYNANLIMLQTTRELIQVNKKMKAISADVCKAWRHIPTIRVDNILDSLPLGAIPVVVECKEACEKVGKKAISLFDFEHPIRAIYIFGPEDGNVCKELTTKVPFRVYVPTSFCMNLAATVNVVLYDRIHKLSQTEFKEDDRPGFVSSRNIEAE